MKHRFIIQNRGSIAQQTDRVLKSLTQSPMSVEELVSELELTKNEVLTSLDRLERQGDVWRKQGRYRAVRSK